MTSAAAADYTRPSNWQDFERFCHALLAEVFKGRIRRWGSAGHRKDGVDAWATLPDGRVVALRFEGRTEHYGQPLAQADVDAALAEAASFPNRIDEFIVLSAGPDDAALQAHAAALGASRKASGQSSVAVWGWPTIAGHIDGHPKVRAAFYGHETKSSPRQKLTLLAAALLVVAGGAGSLFLGKNAIDSAPVKQQSGTSDIGDIVKSLDGFDTAYRQCQAVLDKNVYTFSHALIETCRDPAAASLAELSKKVSKQSPGFDSQMQAELSRILVIFHEDVREAAAATSAAYTFDNEVVKSLKAACGKEAAQESAQDRAAAVKKAGTEAVAAQVRYYFLLRDFIAPELKTAKELVLLHAQQQGTGGPAREAMQAAAGRMERLLTDRTNFAMAATPWPFMLSSIKHTSERTVALDAAQRNDSAEEGYWRDVLAQASTQSLMGRDKDIEALIACGALKEDARALAQPGT